MRLAAAFLMAACVVEAYAQKATSRAQTGALPGEGAVSKIWSPDLGDGRYKNPVLNADYSDPDVTRVGDRFYLVSSSFDSVPGLPILESYDLVNWKLIGHALTRQPPVERYKAVLHGVGVWAPALRYHAGEFYLFYPDPDYGIYMMKAKDAAGPWSAPLLIKAAPGWIDPCPLWDDDGKAYLISALAGSRAHTNSALVLSRMKPDGTGLLDDGSIVYDGHAQDKTIEGPKLYKRHGYYYISAPAGGVTGGWQVVLRSRSIYGPFERRVVLQQGSTAINGPHQGAWVETGTGEDWFLHFQDRAWLGRIVHLEPMKWVDDWPVIGDVSHGSIGEPVATYRKPHVLHAGARENPVDSDEFNGPSLGLQWSWQANPEPSWGFIAPAIGAMRLLNVPSPAGSHHLSLTPNLLLQKLPGTRFTVTTRVSPAFRNEGDRAGLVILGKSYGFIEVAQTKQGASIRQVLGVTAPSGVSEKTLAEVPLQAAEVYLRASVNEGAVRFSYSTDNVKFIDLGDSYQATPGVWIGSKAGIFASGEMDSGDFGYADFDWFRFDLLPH
ncbi:Beta-xylosidase [Granulicella rosea]|uniref:Beta-xylosidase n=1 Tax=Granulicella rosea TaxID=474952 RepID=A0A239LVY5_9BACT|nr:glycoside hydrolase 43 family protein [Granulicella rosea]SNT34430.1 Beta-xylosidase [Granulicella rosea]